MPNKERSYIIRISPASANPVVFDFGTSESSSKKFLDIILAAKAAHTSLEVGVKTLNSQNKLIQSRVSVSSNPPLYKQLRSVSSNLTSKLSFFETKNHSQDLMKTKIRIVLNKEKANRIFLEFPKVEQLYKTKVPSSLSEKQFWTLFVHSHYMKDFSQGSSDELSEEVKNATLLFGDQENFSTEKKRKFAEIVKDSSLLGSMEVYENQGKVTQPDYNAVDPKVDLVTMMYDNYSLVKDTGGLRGTGLELKNGEGIFSRDSNASREDLKLREVLKKHKLSGSIIDEKTISKLKQMPELWALASRYNSHSTVVLDCGTRLHNKDFISSRVSRAKEDEKQANLCFDLGLERKEQPSTSSHFKVRIPNTPFQNDIHTKVFKPGVKLGTINAVVSSKQTDNALIELIEYTGYKNGLQGRQLACISTAREIIFTYWTKGEIVEKHVETTIKELRATANNDLPVRSMLTNLQNLLFYSKTI